MRNLYGLSACGFWHMIGPVFGLSSFIQPPIGKDRVSGSRVEAVVFRF